MTLSYSSYPAEELQATSSKEWKSNVMAKMRETSVCHLREIVILQEKFICSRQERGRRQRERQKTASRKGHGSDLSPYYEHMAGCWARSGAVMSLLIRLSSPSYFTLHLFLAALTHLLYSLTFPSSNLSFLSSLPLLHQPPPSFLPSLKSLPSSLPPSFHPSPVFPAWFRPLAWEEHQSTMG